MMRILTMTTTEHKAMDENSYVELIGTYLSSNNFEKATDTAVNGIKKFPNSLAIQVKYALIAQQKKDWSSAVDRLKKLLYMEDCKPSARTYVSLVQAYRNNKQFELAEAVAHEGLDIFCDNASIQSEYAWNAQTQKKWIVAVERLEKLLVLQGTHVNDKVYVRLIQSLRNAGRLDKVDSILSEGLMRFPHSIGIKDEYSATYINQVKKSNCNNPYQELNEEKFWRSGVVDALISNDEIKNFWIPKFIIDKETRFLTTGSCFAQHISKWLVENGFKWIDSEPAPEHASKQEIKDAGYGVFSFRTGNIYTAALLRQWIAQATGSIPIITDVYTDGDFFYDPFRPLIPITGYLTEAELANARATTFNCIIEAIKNSDVFIFTLGLTEAWVNGNGDIYPVCPGTIKGTFDSEKHFFVNYAYNAILDDLIFVIEEMKIINPKIKFLLTVSPVPLTATASENHVLSATTYSKSVLRSVAGYISDNRDDVDYFPSYELISAFPFKGKFFEDNLRSVTSTGVNFVMKHFEKGINKEYTDKKSTKIKTFSDEPDIVCEDLLLESWQNKKKDFSNAKICLIGDSHMGLLSKSFNKLNVDHAGGLLMVGRFWAASEIELDDADIFIPYHGESFWRDTLPFLKSGNKDGKKTIITNIGMHTHKTAQSLSYWIYEQKIENLNFEDFSKWYESNYSKLIEVVKRLVNDFDYNIIMLTDPPTQKLHPKLGESDVWEIYDDMTESYFASIGCVVLNARKYTKILGFNDSYYTKDYSHGSEQYYDFIAYKLLNMIEVLNKSSASD